MLSRPAVRLYAAISIAAVWFIAATPAHAQFRPRPLNDPATGETYHIEGFAGLWWPTADITIASGGSGALSGIVGTEIDFRNDLGLTDQRFPEVRLTLRPARSHKFRFQYIPINYTQSTTLNRDIKFNGQLYHLALPVNSSLDWGAYRFSYEYDFIVKNRGFGGFVLDAKYTDVQANLATPVANLNEFAHAQAPIPALGGIARVYVVPNISITGEVTAFKLPRIGDRYDGHFADFDLYGTVNVTNYVGAQFGYRLLDVGYLVKKDTGSLTLKGLYLGIVARY
jgi:hypothetical protein